MWSTKNKLKGIGIGLIGALTMQVVNPLFVYATTDVATNKYGFSNGYVINVFEGETVEEFLKHVASNSGVECKIYKGENLAIETDVLATGTTLKVGNSTYVISVAGDANGDSKVTATDLSLAMKAATDLNVLKGAGLKAIDLNNDNAITALDIAKMKMLSVGIDLLSEDVNIDGPIVINVETTRPRQTLGITVQWPSDIEGLTKQISVDGGKTFASDVDEATVNENVVVVARLLDENSKIVKTATLQITNIDKEGPADFNFETTHTIANFITVKGTTPEAEQYYFSKDDGETWNQGPAISNEEYRFTDVTPNSVIPLRMKALDEAENPTITNVKNQKTFKTGIDILEERLSGIAVDKENATITLLDGRKYKVLVTETGSYDVEEIIEETPIIPGEPTEGPDGEETDEPAENPSEDPTEEGEEPNGETDDVPVLLSDTDDEIINSIREIAEEMKALGILNIVDLLDEAISRDILIEEKVNKNRGYFETENGNVYSIRIDENNLEIELAVDKIGTSTEVENGLVATKLLDEIIKGIKSNIIDWAIEAGATTEDLVNRVDSEYKTVTGEYKKVNVDVKTGLYSTETIEDPTKAKLECTLSPEFPVLTNKVGLNVKASYEGGISRIELISEIGYVTKVEFVEDEPEYEMNYSITDNGSYTIKVTTTDGKETEKQVLVSNISTLLPIKVTKNPATSRNTAKTTPQNGVETGAISVTIEFDETLLLENEDKFQYQFGGTDGEWQIATAIQELSGIEENCVIFARYWDGENSLKQLEINIENIDNTAPDAFEFETGSRSNSINVEARALDEAFDAKDGSKTGNKAGKGVGGIARYEYSLDGNTWQSESRLGGLMQDTEYTVYVKAIDYAGNETLASNNGLKVRTGLVPKASECIDITYTPETLTNGTVKVKFTFNGLVDEENNIIQYQILERGEGEANLKSANWVTGNEVEVTDNCVIYVRIVDINGQYNPENDYQVITINNIDNLPPKEFTPIVTGKTKNTITINANVDDEDETPKSLESEISAYKYFITADGGETIEIESENSHYTFTNLLPATQYTIAVEAMDLAGNTRLSSSITVTTNGN